MAWFEDQLKYRKETDDRKFREALEDVSAAVMGQHIRKSLDDRQLARSAIAEILKFYHCRYRDLPEEDGQQSLEEQLDARLRPAGLMRRTVRLEKGWYRQAIGAMLGTLKEDGRAVALIPGRFGGYCLHDLKTQKKLRVNRRIDELLDREALCFYHMLPAKSLKIPDLVLFMLQQFRSGDIAAWLVMMALVTALGMLSPKFTKLLTGDMVTWGNGSLLLALAVFMLFYQFSRTLVSVYQSLLEAKLQTGLSIAVQAAVIGRILSLPAPFFQNFSSGELSRRAAYVQTLCSGIMTTVASVSVSSLFSLVYLVQITAYAPALVLPSLTVTLLTIAFELCMTFFQVKITKKQMETGAKLSGMTYSTISGIQKIKLAGAEKRMFARWARLYAENAKLVYDPPLLLKLRTVISLFISSAGTIVIYSLALQSRVSPSDYYAFNTAYAMVASAISSLGGLAGIFAQIRPVLEMAAPILEAEPEASGDRKPVPELTGAIELSNVSFRYREDMPYVLDHLSLKIRKGEYLAVVGSTGCGKSTLVRLLLGFEMPEKGKIFFDRFDLAHTDLKSLRRRIGVVMQNGSLFSGDIYSNIAIASPGLSMEGAWEAARMAGLEEDIKNMPMEMLTLISEGQGGISGGQKQRILIARALASRPKILILDEATSALDNVTQKHVSDAIDSLHCTRIVIAHRLSTIRHADRILYLENGTVAEEGSYEELLAKDGKFAELIRRQRLDIDV